MFEAVILINQAEKPGWPLVSSRQPSHPRNSAGLG